MELDSMWHVRSAKIDRFVKAPDATAAFGTLRELPLTDFGLIVTAERDEDMDPTGVRTSMLLERWGRTDEAQALRAAVVAAGGPNTAIQDREANLDGWY